MCISPIRIPNNSRVISRYYMTKGYIQVPCGECVECQQSKSLEWQLRARWQFEEVKRSNGYALFDTLTYSDENLPYLSDFLPTSGFDCPCFSLPDVQGFFNRLRAAVRYKYHIRSNESLPLKYFLTSEYGTSERGTHRPHYHIILYCFDNRISPIDLSYLISQCWYFGRTDGAKYNGKRYVNEKRVIRAHTKDGDSIHLHQYVAKYVEKDCAFQRTIKKRLHGYMYSRYKQYLVSLGSTYERDYKSWIFVDDIPYAHGVKEIEDMDYLSWLRSPDVHSLFLRTKHLIEQFHKQSQGFGEMLIDYLDLPYLWETGNVKFRQANKCATVVQMKLPTYYYRKIFQEQIYIGNKLSWQNTDLGKQFREVRSTALVHQLADRMKNVFLTAGRNVDVNWLDLARYAVKIKDSVGFVDVESNVEDKLNHPHYFSVQNKRLYHGRLLSRFLHDESSKFRCHLNPAVPLQDWYSLHVWRDDYAEWTHGFDKLLQEFEELTYQMKSKLQERFEALQELRKRMKVAQHATQLALAL